MDTRELARIDLNLLISLEVLIEEGSVSRAAERLNITQPAMSKTLSRLRQVFDDPLFTRSSHGMQPTPRALELGRDLGNILGDIQSLMAGRRFDPREFQGEVTLALSEYIGVALLPSLLQRLQAQAPGLSLRIITRVENQLEQLALGNLDFAIHIRQARYGTEFEVESLGSSPPVLLVRHDHPLAAAEVSVERMGDYPLIRLYVSDMALLDLQYAAEAVRDIQQPGQAVLEISHLMTALEVLRQTDYIMPGPAYILRNSAVDQGIAALPLPTELSYNIEYVLVGHQRTANSPLHNWLWEQITCTIRDLRPPQPHKARQRVTAGSAHD